MLRLEPALYGPEVLLEVQGVQHVDPLQLALGELIVCPAVLLLQGLDRLLLGPHLGQDGPMLRPEGVQRLLLVVQHRFQRESEFFHWSLFSFSGMSL